MEPKTRVCRYCEQRKPIDEFEAANTVKGKLYRRWKCRTCYNTTKVARKQKTRQWITDLKKTLACEKCGEDDFRVLDFHHNGKKSKDFSIGEAIRKGMSIANIEKEIAKCDVLCCKCHRILHWEETRSVG